MTTNFHSLQLDSNVLHSLKILPSVRGLGVAERLTTEEVRHIALLARLGMSDDDIETTRDQLSNILSHFDALTQLNVADIEPTAQSIDKSNVLRDDSTRECLAVTDVLDNAPRIEGDRIRIRAVLEE